MNLINEVNILKMNMKAHNERYTYMSVQYRQ